MLIKRYDVFTSSRKKGVDFTLNPKGKWVKFADLITKPNKNKSEDLDTFLEGVTGFIEADRDHQMYFYNRCKEYGWLYKGDTSGMLVCVGYFAGQEIWVSLSKANIAGNMVAMYHATSNVVHHGMVRDFINDIAPVSAHDDFGNLNHSDSTNWTNVLIHRDKAA